MNIRWLQFLVLLLAICLTQLAADLYAPALPHIAGYFHSSIASAQWSMAIYMLGVALSQLIYGPLSEGVGRKTPLVAGLGIMLLGSLLCIFAVHMDMLIIGRLIQGCGAGACAALWRPIFRDMFTGEALSQYGSYLVIFVMFIIPAAPVLGSYLLQALGWQSLFVFIGVYTFIALSTIHFCYHETNRHFHQDRLQLGYIAATYKRLLTHRQFMGVTVCTFLSYGAFFAWFSIGPVLLIHVLHVTPVAFGWLTFFGGGCAYALAGWLNGRLVKCWGMPCMMRIGFTIMLVGGLCMFFATALFGLHVWTIIAPMSLFYFGSTFIWPNAFATAFTPFGDIAGYAGSLYGFMQIGGAACIGALITQLPMQNQIPLAGVMLVASLLAWSVYEWACLRKSSEDVKVLCGS
jgi:DHA1 family bicyclomycin/chloramphenicol resistance-like MFS transporter/DHA1 family 2-module integral membrane pump EmrD-like MFS transporter